MPKDVENMREYAPGETIIREGEEGQRMYVLHAGRVRISKTIMSQERTIAELGQGDFFGEMSLLTKKRRNATATALTTVKALELDWITFTRRLHQYNVVAVHMIKTLVSRLDDTLRIVEELYRRNYASRVVRELVRYSMENAGAEDDRPVELHVTRVQLEHETGLQWEHIEAELQRLVHIRMIAWPSEDVVVISSQRLLGSYLMQLESLEEMP